MAEKENKTRKKTEEIKDEAKAAKEEAAVETRTSKKEAADEVKASKKEAGEAAKTEEKEMRTSTENNRRKKAERREAKAARKEANMVEEKKRRPNNAVIAVMIFGVLIGMFAFIWGYNYFQKAESIEKYMEENGMSEVYSRFSIDEYTTAAVKAEGNTIKIVVKVADDAPKDVVSKYKGKEGEKSLKDIGAYYLTAFKPEVRGFSGEARVLAKQGDKKLKYVKMTYREAKKYVKDAEKKAGEETEHEHEHETDETGETSE